MMTSLPKLPASLTVALLACVTLCADTIVIKGSDTLGAKMVPQLSEAFLDHRRVDQGNVTFEIAAEGSSTGIAAVTDATASIGLSSREPSSLEVITARANGVELAPITVAKDGIAVIVNRDNPIGGLTLKELEAIFTGDVREWAAIGDVAGEISVYTRNTSSGTYSAFQALGMRSRAYSPKALKMASNEQIVSEVARNPNGIGYVGLAYIEAAEVKVISVDDYSPADGTAYPLSRPLYYLIDKNAPMDAATNDFIGFTLSPAGQKVVSGVNFIPIY